MRREDWLERMWAELEAAEGRPFEYGRHDCVRLVARCLDVITPAHGYVETVRHLYDGKRRALRLAMNPGLEEMVTRFLGSPVPRNLARVGDVCALDLPTGPAIGICTGPRIAVAASPEGVMYLPLEQATAVWPVD